MDTPGSKAGSTDATVETSTATAPEAGQGLLSAVLADLKLDEPGIADAVPKPEEKPKPEPKAEIPPEVGTETQEELPKEQEEEPEPIAEKAEEPSAEEEPEEEEEAVEARDIDAMRRQRDDAIRRRKNRTKERNLAYAERDRLTQENEQLKQQLQTASAPAPSPQNPLSDVNDIQKLFQLKEQYEHILKFCKLNRDGADGVKIGNETKDLDSKEIAEMEYNADRMLRDYIPQRGQYIHARQQFDSEAYQVHPDLKNDQSTMSQALREIERNLPEITRVPDYKLWVADAIAFRMERMARQQKPPQKQKQESGAKKIVEAASLPNVPTITRSVSRPAGSAAQMDGESAKEKLLSGSGDNNALEALVASKLQGGRSGAVRPAAS